MPVHESLELGHELVVVAEGELGLDAILERGDMELLEPRDLVLREPLVGEIGERCPVPERQCLPQPVRGIGVVAGLECHPALSEQPLEAVAIELSRLDRNAVGAADGADRVSRELLAQRRDAVLQDLGGGRRRILAPELVDDHVAGERLVRVEEEQRQDRALLGAAERELSLAVERLKRPEDAVVHGGSE